MPPRCPSRTGSGHCRLQPRATISSLCLAATSPPPPPQPCSCHEQVCTEETCASTVACAKIDSGFCPHGLATDVGECYDCFLRENSDQQSVGQGGSRSVQQNQSEAGCCRPATTGKLQHSQVATMAPPITPSESGVVICCSGCPVKTPSQATSVNDNQPKPNYSQCGPHCGAIENKDTNRATYSCNLCEGREASGSASRQAVPQCASHSDSQYIRHIHQTESNCCKSGSGPHTSQEPAPRESRTPSLVRIQDNNQQQNPLAQQRTPCCQKNNSPGEQGGSTCPHSGAGLFPAKAPQNPCLCVMPPAYNMKCTGNLAGNCTCSRCNK